MQCVGLCAHAFETPKILHPILRIGLLCHIKFFLEYSFQGKNKLGLTSVKCHGLNKVAFHF